MPDNSTGQSGNGVRIFIALASPHTWLEVTGILGEPTIPEITRTRIESSIHGSQGLKSNVTGLGEVNDLEFELRADLTAGGRHTYLRDLRDARTDVWIRVQIPVSNDLSTTNYIATQFIGRFISWVPNTPIDGLKTISVSALFVSSYMSQNEMASVTPA